MEVLRIVSTIPWELTVSIAVPSNSNDLDVAIDNVITNQGCSERILRVKDLANGSSLECQVPIDGDIVDVSSNMLNSILNVFVRTSPVTDALGTQEKDAPSSGTDRPPHRFGEVACGLTVDTKSSPPASIHQPEQPLPQTPSLSSDVEAAQSEDSTGSLPDAQPDETAKKKNKKKRKKKGQTASRQPEKGVEEAVHPTSTTDGEGTAPGGKLDPGASPALVAKTQSATRVSPSEAVGDSRDSASASTNPERSQFDSKESQADSRSIHHEPDLTEADGEQTKPATALVVARPEGRFEIGLETPRLSNASGLIAHEALSKEASRDKSKQPEDKWLLKPHCTWGLQTSVVDGDASSSEVSKERLQQGVGFGAWGVFDGHGGKHVATFASNSLLKYIMEEASKDTELRATPPQRDGASSFSGSHIKLLDTVDLPEVAGLSLQELEEWRLQAELVRRLPSAMKAGFLRCNEEAFRRFKSQNGGGTTATVAIAVGWDLIVANVGDSAAYLDTGSEVLAVSVNHRLDDNKAERERIEAAGGEVARSTVDGKPAGPLRVWPGGLAMGRTLGDLDAGDLATAEPEVCHVAMPREGGRLLVGSDGLWDAIHPKTAAHHCRGMTAAEAAHKLLALAIKQDKLKDDVTVVIVDFVPDCGDKICPALARAAAKKEGGGGQGAKANHIPVWHPLVPSGEGNYLETNAARRRQVLEEAVAAAEAESEEDRRRQEARAEMAAETARQALLSTERASNGGGGGGEMKGGLYEELLNFKLNPEEIAEAMEQGAKLAAQDQDRQRIEAERGEWQEVIKPSPAVCGSVTGREDEPQDGGACGGGGGGGGRQDRRPRGGRGRAKAKQQQQQRDDADISAIAEQDSSRGNRNVGGAAKKMLEATKGKNEAESGLSSQGQTADADVADQPKQGPNRGEGKPSRRGRGKQQRGSSRRPLATDVGAGSAVAQLQAPQIVDEKHHRSNSANVNALQPPSSMQTASGPAPFAPLPLPNPSAPALVDFQALPQREPQQHRRQRNSKQTSQTSEKLATERPVTGVAAEQARGDVRRRQRQRGGGKGGGGITTNIGLPPAEATDAVRRHGAVRPDEAVPKAGTHVTSATQGKQRGGVRGGRGRQRGGSKGEMRVDAEPGPH